MNTKLANSKSIQTHGLVLLVLVLTLWAGFAFIEHQQDIVQEHHSNHHCQLFSAANQAIASSFPLLPVVIQKPICFNLPRFFSISRTLPIQKARAPPRLPQYFLQHSFIQKTYN